MNFRMVVRHDKMEKQIAGLFYYFFFVNLEGLRLTKSSEKNIKCTSRNRQKKSVASFSFCHDAQPC